jgi:hypothetical protein
MSINAWKTSFIGINKPPKVLTGSADSFKPVALWPYANDATDPYWSGGTNPQAYKWEVSFTIIPVGHGSNLTRTPYSFTGHDIEVGDFVAGSQDGKVLEIISINSKTDTSLVAVVEDRLRYNTFRDPTGFGLFGTPGTVVFFQINELGLPMLDPIPGGTSVNFFSDVQSRFQYMNPLTNYILEKTNHGFVQGDPISIENKNFEITNANNVKKFIGTVVYAGPGPNQFVIRPSNGIIDFNPNLPGDIGDYIYPSSDGSGILTTDATSNKPIFIKISNAVPTITTGTGIDPTGIDGDTIQINRAPITLIGSGTGTYTLDEAITQINAVTATTQITAIKVGAANIITSDIAANGSALGVIAGYVPFSASINGVTVNFITTTSGSATYGDPTVAAAVDMVADINAANIPDLVASLDESGNIILRQNAGDAITIVNLTNDLQGNKFAGANSISSLIESVPANTTTSALRLYRDDGGPMTLLDTQGIFLSTAGVLSGQNGRYAIGLNVEQGLRSSLLTMVPTIESRNALHPLPGDQAYVLDAGHGDWEIYVWDGTNWLRFNNQRSDATDARTISQEITLPGDTATTIGTITEGRRILNVSVSVTTALVDAPDFYIAVGSDNVWYYNQNGAPGVGTYTVESESVTSARSDVVINIPSNTASGTFKVEVTYV